MPDETCASDEERQEALADAVQHALAHGRRVEALGPFMAVVVRGRHPNHLLHFLIVAGLIGIASVGWLALEIVGGRGGAMFLLPVVWVVVWVVLRFGFGEKREMITVDETGDADWGQP